MAEAIQTLLEMLRILKSKNDWLGIYNKFKPVEDFPQNDMIWNNPKILSDIGFACTQLARTDSISQEIFRDQQRKDALLKRLSEYRKYALSIQKRCVELEPNNPLHYANIAYIFYQNINDLRQPRGRRDGNLREEIEDFITTVDKALMLDTKPRVNDLYRKGRVLSRILPDLILWSKSYEDLGDFGARIVKANEKRDQGIQTLLCAKHNWEELDPNHPDDHYWHKRYRKDYIKTLYSLSHAYYEKIKEDWNESVFTLNDRDYLNPNRQIIIDHADKSSIDKAIKAIKKCCKTDCPHQIVEDVKQNQQSLEKIASYNGQYEGVDKLYTIGKFFFAKYWILSEKGFNETEDAVIARQTAERYLQAALKCEWSSQKAKQDKRFIAERLARVFISKEEYDQAISIIAENTLNLNLKNADPYLLHTCAIALLKSGKIEQTQKFLDSAKDSRRNTQPWLTYFLKGCAYLEEDKTGNAQEQFALAHQRAERVGKKNVDSLLIAKAFVEYKSDNVSEALKFLEEAQKLNPYRVSVGERIKKWKQSMA